MTAAIKSYRDLIAWQKARVLARHVYEITSGLPRHEVYGLAQQARRAAVSVPSNIAEGYGRGTRKDYIHFLQIARGSLYELETQLMVAEDLKYLTQQQSEWILSLTNEVSRILQGLLASLTRVKETDA